MTYVESSLTNLQRKLIVKQSTTLLTDHPTIRSASSMPPLLQRLTERKPESLDYLGVSYGLTSQLLRFALSTFLSRRSLLSLSGSGSVRATHHYTSARLRANLLENTPWSWLVDSNRPHTKNSDGWGSFLKVSPHRVDPLLENKHDSFFYRLPAAIPYPPVV